MSGALYPVSFWGVASWCGCGLVLSTPVSAGSTSACRRACLLRVGFATRVRAHRPARNAARSSRQAVPASRADGRQSCPPGACHAWHRGLRGSSLFSESRWPRTVCHCRGAASTARLARLRLPPCSPQPCGPHRIRRRLAAGRGAMTRPSLHPPPGVRRTAGRAPPLRCVSAGSAPDGGGLAVRNAPGGDTRLVSPRMRRLRHSGISRAWPFFPIF